MLQMHSDLVPASGLIANENVVIQERIKNSWPQFHVFAERQNYCGLHPFSRTNQATG
uniref:Uncharacterized protein n=1 Tax=Anguilla anguilla TaxID=7936 RepID=A0A0E9PCY6_ANGAN